MVSCVTVVVVLSLRKNNTMTQNDRQNIFHVHVMSVHVIVYLS